jgi:hypothetical protein
MPIAKFITASVLFSAALGAQSLTGQWDCTVNVNGTKSPSEWSSPPTATR